MTITPEQLRIVDLEQALLLERERLEKTKAERQEAWSAFDGLLSVLKDTGQHVCIYCGHVGSPAGIKAHLEACEKHPMAKLRAMAADECARAEALADSIRAMQAALETDKTSALAVALRATCTSALAFELPRRPSLQDVYEERNRVVAALAHVALRLGWRAGLRAHEPDPDPSWDADWRNVVLVDLPTGQVSWHYHDSARPLFEGLPAYAGAWDGHTTAQKYQRCAALFPGQVLDALAAESQRIGLGDYHAVPPPRITDGEADAGRAGHAEELVHVPPADARGAGDVRGDPRDGAQLRDAAHGEVPTVGGPDRGAAQAPGVRGDGEHVDRLPGKVDQDLRIDLEQLRQIAPGVDTDELLQVSFADLKRLVGLSSREMQQQPRMVVEAYYAIRCGYCGDVEEGVKVGERMRCGGVSGLVHVHGRAAPKCALCMDAGYIATTQGRPHTYQLVREPCPRCSLSLQGGADRHA